jgi:hypothetical protein
VFGGRGCVKIKPFREKKSFGDLFSSFQKIVPIIISGNPFLVSWILAVRGKPPKPHTRPYFWAR